jgi:hypothetical protein
MVERSVKSLEVENMIHHKSKSPWPFVLLLNQNSSSMLLLTTGSKSCSSCWLLLCFSSSFYRLSFHVLADSYCASLFFRNYNILYPTVAGFCEPIWYGGDFLELLDQLIFSLSSWLVSAEIRKRPAPV